MLDDGDFESISEEEICRERSNSSDSADTSAAAANAPYSSSAELSISSAFLIPSTSLHIDDPAA